MYRAWCCSLILCSQICAVPLQGATGRVVKVLPHFLDLQGRHTLSPSLYERDAYQAFLRLHPEKRSTMRFDVDWRTRGAIWEPLTLRIELRGIAEANLPKELTIDREVHRGGWFGQWTGVALSREEYKSLGEVTAWRVTLWEGEKQLAEQRSFLW